ncbi:hypothetical protein T484DRAFT_1920199, partial [Baffinella frigidus]
MGAASTPPLAEVRWRGRHFLELRRCSTREESTGLVRDVRYCAGHAVGVRRVKQTDQQEGGPYSPPGSAGARMRCSTLPLRAVRGGGDPGTAGERASTETEPTGGWEEGTMSDLDGRLGKLGVREQAGKGGSAGAARETWRADWAEARQPNSSLGDAKFRENMRRAFAPRPGPGPPKPSAPAPELSRRQTVIRWIVQGVLHRLVYPVAWAFRAFWHSCGRFWGETGSYFVAGNVAMAEGGLIGGLAWLHTEWAK